jgi:hypothetical protein
MLTGNGGIRLNAKLSEDDYYDDPHADKSDNGIINSYRSDPTDEDREDFKRTMEEIAFKEGNLEDGLDGDDKHFLELIRGRR